MTLFIVVRYHPLEKYPWFGIIGSQDESTLESLGKDLTAACNEYEAMKRKAAKMAK
jgi:hypothetical protein